MFFTTISVISATKGAASTSVLAVVGIVVLPFVIGIAAGGAAALIMRKIKNNAALFILFFSGLLLSTVCGLLTDIWLFGSFSLNYLLIGMAYSATVANAVKDETLAPVMKKYDPLLSLSLVIVIVNLGMPLDYRLIAGAGVFTAVYILSRAAGKISGAFLGGKLTKADPKVTKYLGFTLLPHSGVSLIFTGIAVNTLNAIDTSLAAVISGTIVSAAIINEIIAVLLAKAAFRWAGEIPPEPEQPDALSQNKP